MAQAGLEQGPRKAGESGGATGRRGPPGFTRRKSSAGAVARLAAMAPALSRQPRVVVVTSLLDSRSPPPPPQHPACLAAEAVLAAAVVSASPPPPPRPVRRPAALAGWGTVVVDGRPCLREGEFPPRRRGQPRLQPLSAEAQLGAPRMYEMADSVGARVPRSLRPLPPADRGARTPSGVWRCEWEREAAR